MLELKPLETFYSLCKGKHCYYICFSPREFLEQGGNIPPCFFLPTPPYSHIWEQNKPSGKSNKTKAQTYHFIFPLKNQLGCI